MKRFAKIISPVALLALFVIGAAPATKKTANPTVPSAPAPEVSATASEPSQLDLQIADPTTSTPVANPEAASASSTYNIDWYSINGGGTTNASSTNYKMGASVGQSVAGAASSTNYQMGIGFWYGAGGACNCVCKYDPSCDGIISDVLDVTTTINIAFRGIPSVSDPGCPTERADVDNSGAIDVVDVSKVINVAFRGNTIASQYVDPCP